MLNLFDHHRHDDNLFVIRDSQSLAYYFLLDIARVDKKSMMPRILNQMKKLVINSLQLKKHTRRKHKTRGDA